MPSQRELMKTIEQLERHQKYSKIDGDIDVEYFDTLISQLYVNQKWLNLDLAARAKNAIDLLEYEIRVQLRRLILTSSGVKDSKRALKSYSLFLSMHSGARIFRNA